MIFSHIIYMKNVNETWKPVLGYESYYEVSDLGRVRSLNYKCTGNVQVLREARIKRDEEYLGVYLSKDGQGKTKQVHRLVYEAFYGPIPEGLQINHINEDPSDNRLANLNVMTPKENTNYGTHTTRQAETLIRKHHCGKPVDQYDMQGNLIATYWGAHEASRQTGVCRGRITECCLGRIRTSGGYIWRYHTEAQE